MIARDNGSASRLKRAQNILYFGTIALLIKLVFFKSLKFRRIFTVLIRLLLGSLSALAGQLGVGRK